MKGLLIGNASHITDIAHQGVEYTGRALPGQRVSSQQVAGHLPEPWSPGQKGDSQQLSLDTRTDKIACFPQRIWGTIVPRIIAGNLGSPPHLPEDYEQRHGFTTCSWAEHTVGVLREYCQN